MQIKIPESHYDVVVVGGGLVGSSLASLLQRLSASSLRVLVVEAFSHALDADAQLPASTDFDKRTTALSWRSRQIYEQAGLWADLAPHGCAIERIHVSDRGRLGAVSLAASESGVSALGYVMANRELGSTLLHAVARSEDIALLCPARITALKPRRDGMQLQLQCGDGAEPVSLHAALVVLADGGKSGLCDELGISIERRHYHQQALIANIAFERAHRGVAFERFTDQGPLAVLPLPALDGQHCGSLIWTLPEDQVAHIRTLDDDGLLQHLQQRFGHRLGRLQRVGQRDWYALTLAVASEQVRPGLVLLGNVAHTLHPVAGQGLNLALRDALVLAEHLVAAAAAGRSVGEMVVLQAYQRRQQQDQELTIAFSHHVTELFASQHLLQVWTRKLGLAAIDLLPPARRLFARQAMGMASRDSVVRLP